MKNHKIIRNTQKKQKYFQEKEKNIVCSLQTSIAIIHNVTRSYEYKKGGFSEMKKKVISLILAATIDVYKRQQPVQKKGQKDRNQDGRKSPDCLLYTSRCV